MSEAPGELRRFPRFPLTWPVAFSGVHIEGQGNLGNLSWEGCRVVSQTSLQQGSYLVDLKLQCPEWDTPLSVEMAQVRWAKGQGARHHVETYKKAYVLSCRRLFTNPYDS